jgi:hypothetical protein
VINNCNSWILNLALRKVAGRLLKDYSRKFCSRLTEHRGTHELVVADGLEIGVEIQYFLSVKAFDNDIIFRDSILHVWLMDSQKFSYKIKNLI